MDLEQEKRRKKKKKEEKKKKKKEKEQDVAIVRFRWCGQQQQHQILPYHLIPSQHDPLVSFVSHVIV